MADSPLSVLQVNTADVGGGAEAVAWNLFQAYRRAGNTSQLAVGHRRTDDPDVLPIQSRRGKSRLRQWLARWRGHEDFDFPGTWSLLSLSKRPPDIIHCHNLHGFYFDLNTLAWLSGHVPVIVTLHDAWLLSGHCAHSFDCTRWQTGCGNCPDLSIYPSVLRDGTAFNWQRKAGIMPPRGSDMAGISPGTGSLRCAATTRSPRMPSRAPIVPTRASTSPA